MSTASIAHPRRAQLEVPRDIFPPWWENDPAPIRDYLEMATAEGLTVTTIDHARHGLLYYSRFLKEEFDSDLSRAGWEEFAAYRRYLMEKGLSRSSVKTYLGSVLSYYVLLSRQKGDPSALELYTKMKVVEGNIGLGVKRHPAEPFAFAPLLQVIRAAGSYDRIWRPNHWIASEDLTFILTLLYTGGRAQFYGLRVDEVDFEHDEIRTRVKGGAPITIPLHPKLASVLKAHLATRQYESPFLFRNGKDPSTLRGRNANHANAMAVCERVRKASGLKERVYPHRFRKTLATLGRRLGMDLQHVQAILGHRNLLQTMNLYVRPDLEEVKQDFARLDLMNARRRDGKASQIQVIAALRGLAPRGKEAAWGMIVDGFVEILTGRRPREDEYVRDSFDNQQLANRMWHRSA